VLGYVAGAAGVDRLAIAGELVERRRRLEDIRTQRASRFLLPGRPGSSGLVILAVGVAARGRRD
jgi:hypothetical protein